MTFGSFSRSFYEFDHIFQDFIHISRTIHEIRFSITIIVIKVIGHRQGHLTMTSILLIFQLDVQRLLLVVEQCNNPHCLEHFLAFLECVNGFELRRTVFKLLNVT